MDENAEAVAHICQRLDGIPLAIELAASRCRQMSVDRIGRELDDRFRLLTGGARTAMARQQTLGASIDWSHDLLDEAERVAFRRLGVFAGPFPLEAAEAVVAAPGDLDPAEAFDLVIRLTDRSLMVAGESAHGETTFRLLESLRAYALDRAKDAGEIAELRDATLFGGRTGSPRQPTSPPTTSSSNSSRSTRTSRRHSTGAPTSRRWVCACCGASREHGRRQALLATRWTRSTCFSSTSTLSASARNGSRPRAGRSSSATTRVGWTGTRRCGTASTALPNASATLTTWC